MRGNRAFQEKSIFQCIFRIAAKNSLAESFVERGVLRPLPLSGNSIDSYTYFLVKGNTNLARHILN